MAHAILCLHCHKTRWTEDATAPLEAICDRCSRKRRIRQPDGAINPYALWHAYLSENIHLHVLPPEQPPKDA